MDTPEAKVKKDIKRVLSDHGILPDEGGPCGWYFMPVAGRFGRRGVADFICNVQGKFLAIEAKSVVNGNKESGPQVMCRKAITKTKGKSVVIDETNLDTLPKILSEIL